MSILYDASEPSLPYDLYARRARAITEKYIKVGGPGEVIVPPRPAPTPSSGPVLPVGILGAGQYLPFL